MNATSGLMPIIMLCAACAVLVCGCVEDDGCPAIQRYVTIDIRGVPGAEIVGVVVAQGERVHDITESCERRLDGDGALCSAYPAILTHQLPVEVRVETTTGTRSQTATLREDGCWVEPDPLVIELP